uniref:NR LBD domain-containing protein n=2 Tax=Macrostomum lignano TaxID=282301 RepID=A0A1I8GIA3_9PLAT
MERLRDLRLDATEFGLLRAVALFHSDAVADSPADRQLTLQIDAEQLRAVKSLEELLTGRFAVSLLLLASMRSLPRKRLEQAALPQPQGRQRSLETILRAGLHVHVGALENLTA